MHLGVFVHFVKIFLLIWVSAGAVTAIYGLFWTCKKSDEMLNEIPPAAPTASTSAAD